MARETEIQSRLAKRAERQNQSILVFTIITVIFLPLSFFTSYFGQYSKLVTRLSNLEMIPLATITDLWPGMNTRDIRDTDFRQWFFWAIAAPISVFIIAFALFFAFRRSIEHWYRSLGKKELPVQKQEEMSEWEETE